MMNSYTQSFLRDLDAEETPFLAHYLERQEPDYYIALDLGQASDYSALVVVSLTHQVFDGRLEPFCSVPHIVRWQLGTAYPTIVGEVSRRMSSAPANTRLVLDGTGVGRAVVDMFLQHPLLDPRRGRIVPVTITAGQHETFEDGYRRIPKRNLVGSTQVLLQSGRLKIASELPETQILVEELQNFRVTITAAGNDTYAAWRENAHDDLVLALALGCWAATNRSVNAEFRQRDWFR